ncbi:MAG TPA: hypothetical protein VKU40_11575 [Thermoanaerobaculia bacterium]|nr:hypothetical protein [Thermoanaerobaculia bacterium]
MKQPIEGSEVSVTRPSNKSIVGRYLLGAASLGAALWLLAVAEADDLGARGVAVALVLGSVHLWARHGWRRARWALVVPGVAVLACLAFTWRTTEATAPATAPASLPDSLPQPEPQEMVLSPPWLDDLPEASLSSAAGEPTTLAALTGDGSPTLVLLFRATDCASGLEELLATAAEVRRAHPGSRVLGLALDTHWSELRGVLDHYGFDLPVYLLPAAHGENQPVAATPFAMVVGPHGEVAEPVRFDDPAWRLALTGARSG